jgi:phospholipid transport system substrate-binding protein
MNRQTKTVLTVFLFLSMLASPPAFAMTPAEQLQGTIQQVLSVVQNAAHSEQRRQEMLRETLMPMFDWPEMAKQSLGKHWNLAAGREHEFVSAFADFLGNSYVGTIASYKDEKIQFVREAVEKDRAQVNTVIVPNQGDATAVNYRLHRVGGEWKIYDVVVEDISLVVNFRSQFSRILAKGSLDDLLKQLKDKENRPRN